jgi:2-methylaconitate isomerase
MAQRSIPAVFMRGGTSNALVFHRHDLPANEAEWSALFLAAMGSPDPNGRQLNGMGGGISSLSKICVIGPSTRSDADIDYSFFQIGVSDESVDISGNCGNMSSAMGPFALDEGLVAAPVDGGEAKVRIHNTNTSKVIVGTFPTEAGRARVTGEFNLDGVAGTGAPVRLEFLDPGGAGTGRLLPTGNAIDRLDVPGLGVIDASMVDAANPCVFIDAASVGRKGTELPDALDGDEECLTALEAIRCAASVAMGIAPTPEAAAAIPSIPKVAMVFSPTASPTLSGRMLAEDDFDIGIRMISIGRPHRAVPLTGGICLAVAVRIPDSLPSRLAKSGPEAIRVGQPSGILTVDAEVTIASDTTAHAVHGAVYRTARRMFEGNVLIPG